MYSLTMKIGKVTLVAFREQIQEVLDKGVLLYPGTWHVFLYLARAVMGTINLPKLF